MSSADSVLKEVFGYDSFRDRQREIVEQISGGGNALVLMPTGGGKSICFQLPAVLRQRAGQGVTVVVSPLIALMRDQVMALKELGISAAYLNSSLSAQEFSAVKRQLLAGELTLLYAAPERVIDQYFLEDLKQLQANGKLSMFAIDEAHCVSQWGHDFRPEYVGLKVLTELFPEVPRVALTATADELTREEITKNLGLDRAQIYISSFDRPNIHYQIVEKINVRRQLLGLIRQHSDQAGIVYCLSRKRVEEIAAWLVEQGVEALPYHAGISTEIRQRNQDRFLREDGVVIVATIAFGMGIDKPDVRFVAHVDMPKNIEGYYQETGRAGRDGEPAHAWMAYGLQDVVMQRSMLEGSEASAQYKQVLRRKLDALLGLCESVTCRRIQLLDYFGESSQPCGNCDNCQQAPTTWDASEAAKKLLSCIYRCDQNFGAGHILDVLAGKETEKVLRFGHSSLSTFGIGRDLSQPQWRSVLRQLIATGMVRVDSDHFNVLKLGDGWYEFVTGEQALPVRVITKEAKQARVRTAPKVAVETELDQPGQGLFQQLRQWRKEQADQRGVPAFVILHDATLKAIAAAAPTTLEQLAQIKGIGATKQKTYGPSLIELIEKQNS